MRSRLLVFAVVLVVAAAVGWWWKFERVDAHVAAPSVETSSSEATQPKRADVLTAPDASVAETRAEAAPIVEVIATPDTAAAATPLGENEAWIEITAVAKEDGRVLPNVRVYAHPLNASSWSASSVEGSVGSETESPHTGADGIARVRVRAGIAYELSANLEDPPESSVESDVAALESGETRAVRLELPTTSDLAFFARVVSKEDHLPIAGATITQLTERWGSGEGAHDTVVAGAPILRSDSDGRFELRGESWKHVLLRIEATGFGRRLAALRAGHETRERALAIELGRVGRLDITVLGVAAAGPESVRASATTDGYHLAQRETEFDYFSNGEQLWEADVGGDGRATLAELPSGAPLQIVVRAGERVLAELHEPVTLAPGEERALEIELGVGATVVGTLRDEGNRPIADETVWLRSAADSTGGFYSWQEPLRQAQTDAQGAFELPDVGVGKWAVGLAPGEYGKQVDPETALAGRPVEVAIAPSDRRVSVELRVTRGLSIRGRVVDRSGVAVAGVHVTAWGDTFSPSTESGADGTFTLAPVTAGDYHVQAGGFDEWADSDSKQVRGGEQEVVIVVERAGALSIAGIDESGAAVRRGQLMWCPVGTDGTFGGMWMSNFDGETRAITGMRPGSWDFVLTTIDGSIGAERAVVAAGGDPKRVVIRVHPGGTLLVRNSKSEGSDSFRVLSSGVCFAQGQASKDEIATVTAPAGTLRIEWSAAATQEPRSREVRLGVAEKLEVDLADG